MKTYKELSDKEKKIIIQKLYEKENKSFSDIAKEYDTYANKIRRDAIKYEINIKNKSEAQKLVLSKGKAKHPTKGKQRTEEEKNNIGMGVYKAWQSIDEEMLEKRKQKSADNWQKIDRNKKQNMMNQANKAVRLASKTGSKLEKFFLQGLIDAGYRVEFHKQQVLGNTKLEIDLFLPTINIAVEVDGPSHFKDIWGSDNLKKNQTYDRKKTGLILGRGWYLVRVKQDKDFSKSYANILLKKLVQQISTIESSGSNIKEFFIEE